MSFGPAEFDAVAAEMMAILPETIVQVDEQGRVSWVNHPESQVFRKRAERDVLLVDLVMPEAVDTVTALLRTANLGDDVLAEYRLDVDLYRVTARRLTSEPSTMLTFRNITAIRRAGQTIVDLVRDRSAFLEAVSNELKSPLAAVIGYATLLSDREALIDDSSRTEIARGMTDQAWDLAGIIEDLLTIASGELGELHLAKVQVDLSGNAAQVVESMGAMGESVEIVEGSPVYGVGDPGRFRQVVRNLVSNALRHGAEPVTITIGQDGDRAFLAVEDCGDGLSQELTRIVGESRASVPGTLGVGLWICQELTQLMGGSLSYQRVDGRTVFVASIPLL